MFNKIDADAESLRTGKKTENEIAAAFDEIVGQVDENADDDLPQESLEVVPDRFTELQSLAHDLGRQANKTSSLKSDIDLDKAIDQMSQNTNVDDALKGLDGINF